ncbi:MAG: hypothetical protein ACSLE6_06585 [Mycobacterium sp.]
MLDAVVVRREAVIAAPEGGLSSAPHVDLAVDAADVGLVTIIVLGIVGSIIGAVMAQIELLSP